MKKIFLLAAALILLVSSAPVAAHGPDEPEEGADGFHPAFLAYRLGLYWLAKGELSLAEAKFDEAIARLPNYHQAYTARFVVRLRAGKLTKAAADVVGCLWYWVTSRHSWRYQATNFSTLLELGK